VDDVDRESGTDRPLEFAGAAGWVGDGAARPLQIKSLEHRDRSIPAAGPSAIRVTDKDLGHVSSVFKPSKRSFQERLLGPKTDNHSVF
jgi:hypothetical protein